MVLGKSGERGGLSPPHAFCLEPLLSLVRVLARLTLVVACAGAPATPSPPAPTYVPRSDRSAHDRRLAVLEASEPGEVVREQKEAAVGTRVSGK